MSRVKKVRKKPAPFRTKKRGGKPSSISHTGIVKSLAPQVERSSTKPSRRIYKVLVALDVGTSYTKATYITFRNKNQALPKLLRDRNLISRMETIVWPNNLTQCPTQMAFVKNPDDNDSTGGEVQELWGAEVEMALDDRKIKEEDCLKWIKPSMYHEARSKAVHHNRLQKRLEDLSLAGIEVKVQQSDNAHSSPGQGETRKLEAEDVWKLYHKHAWAHILKQIKKFHPDVRWPPRDQTQSGLTQSPDEYTQVEVALPMPAGATPQHVQMALDTARRAGIPNVYPVAEPAAAAAYAAQADFQRDNAFTYQGTTLVCDHGGGTVDIILCAIERLPSSQSDVEENSDDSYFELHEEVAGVQRWCGSAFQNEHFRKLFLAEHNVQWIVDQLRCRGIEKTEDEFMEGLERIFDKKKILFTGENLASCQHMVLQVPGVPKVNTSHFRMGNDTVIIKSSGVQKIFQPPLRSIISLINSQISAFHGRNCGSDGVLRKRVERILLVGGGNESPFVRNAIEQECGNVKLNASDDTPLYQIQVSKVSRDDSSSLATVKGALLLLMDKPFVRERVARRGFCFTWDPIARENERYESGRTYLDAASGCLRVKDSAEFFIRRGDRISDGQQWRVCRGSRLLYLDVITEQGWEIRETLWYTDHVCDDDAWVTSPRSKFGKAGEIFFYLEEVDSEGFPANIDLNGKLYKETEYELEVVIRGFVMEYKLIIPRSGKFGAGTSCIERVGRVDCRSMYQLYDPASRV